MANFFFYSSLLVVLGLSNPVVARNAEQALHCQLQVPAAVMGSGIWYQMGYPFNLTANNLGLIPGSTAYQLAELAYQLQQQGLPETAITQQVQQRCTGFSLSELTQDSSFFAENGATPPELTACGDATTLVVQSFSMLEAQPVTIDNLLAVILGEQHIPTIRQLAEFAVSLKQQQQLETTILERLFSYCQEQSISFKQQLAADYYTQ
ncbi:hypothetical protein GCM10010919_03340 [Alishewanella longhuensis]|uniref:Uncharacterized protein n=1 Tax=Alishewanella longhuensis TaxID=1091037 RepID=A0ABQ3KVX6_9ALTE|nr:hypothetical protein [Alishewanella longhuensis]GHG60141.1 hypothetical protein GCM10010919_03340 [Alishewanella longhuensis]